MKINFINGKLAWSGKWNVRLVQSRGMRTESMGTFIPKGSTDIEFKQDEKVQANYDENHITVVRQPTKCRTLFILFHELCHWLVHLVFRHNYLSRGKWHDREEVDGKMKFKSTLEKEVKKSEEDLKKAIANGYKSEAVDEVFELVTGCEVAMDCMYHRAIYVAKTIQPSITKEDLKIACDMIYATASQLVHNLIKEGLIGINKKEA